MCKHVKTKQEICEDGPHYAKLICVTCEAFVKWVPKPKAKAKFKRKNFKAEKRSEGFAFFRGKQMSPSRKRKCVADRNRRRRQWAANPAAWMTFPKQNIDEISGEGNEQKC